MKRKHRQKNRFAGTYIAVLTCILYIPIVLTVIYSFNTSKISSVWGGLSLTWYETLFCDRDMWEAVWNSIFLAVCSGLLANIIGVTGALGVHKSGKYSHRVVSFSSMIPIMIPEIILGMAFLAIFSFMNFPFGMLTLILAHTSFCVPYVFLMVKARLEDMDSSIEEAAKDLGASSWQVFRDITFPAILPAILSASLLAFAMSFDDVVISIFVTGPSTNTLAIKIYTKLKTGVTPEINALATVMLVFILLVMVFYSSVRKYISKHNE